MKWPVGSTLAVDPNMMVDPNMISMKYKPAIHHHRSIRLKGYDYSKQGMYFITICCHQRKCWFGKIENENMVLNEYGMIAFNEWYDLPNRFPNIVLGEFVIMPNHMHRIIVIKPFDVISSESVSGANPDPTKQTGTTEQPEPTNPTIGDMIGAYKSLTAVECLKIFKTNNINQMMGKLWQRNYYEHIVRDEQSLNRISTYIINNPKNWQIDKFHA